MTRWVSEFVLWVGVFIFFLPCAATGGLVVINTDYAGGTLVATGSGNDANTPDGSAITHNYSQSFSVDGVSFTLSFDLTAEGNGTGDDGPPIVRLHNGLASNQDDAIGVWSAGEISSTDRSSVNDGESLTVHNIQFSGVSGGTIDDFGIAKAGFRAAADATDGGQIIVEGDDSTPLAWDNLGDGDVFDMAGSLDAGMGHVFCLEDSFLNNAGCDLNELGNGPSEPGEAGIGSFQVIASSGAWHLDAVQFNVVTTVPEPNASWLVGFVVAGVIGFSQIKQLGWLGRDG